MLYIIPTPLGNLDDFSKRAQDTMSQCDFIIAENPAYSSKLINHFGLPKKEFFQFAEHNEKIVLDELVERLQNENGCLISDAGTPGISDPGFRLVRACREAGIEVTPLPGPNAAVTALCASGLPTDRFMFMGFLQKTEHKVLQAVEMARDTESTLVVYESPQRILKTVGYIAGKYPDAKIVIARELTKLHEEFILGSAAEVLENLKQRPAIKGEITLLVSFK